MCLLCKKAIPGLAPLQYEGTNVLRTTITFNYDVYNFKIMNNIFDTVKSVVVSNSGVKQNFAILLHLVKKQIF
jgi:hypothetical protein